MFMHKLSVNSDGKITIRFDFNEFPAYYKNFRKMVFEKSNSTFLFFDSLNRELREYNGCYDVETATLTFASEEDFMFFVLKWS